MNISYAKSCPALGSLRLSQTRRRSASRAKLFIHQGTVTGRKRKVKKKEMKVGEKRKAFIYQGLERQARGSKPRRQEACERPYLFAAVLRRMQTNPA